MKQFLMRTMIVMLLIASILLLAANLGQQVALITLITMFGLGCSAGIAAWVTIYVDGRRENKQQQTNEREK